MKLLFTSLFSLLFAASFGQIIKGVCKDDKSGKAIPFINIVNGKNYTYTDTKGNFEIPGKAGDSLVFSHISYRRYTIKIEEGRSGEEVLQVKMESINKELSPFVVNGTQRPDTLVASPLWMIRDFFFFHDSLLLLTWEKNPNKCFLRLTDLNGTESASLPIKDKPLGFFKDVAGNIYLECKANTYRIDHYKGALYLQDVDEMTYYNAVRPGVGLSPKALFSTTWTAQKPEFAYLNINLKNPSADTMIHICDQHLYDLYYAEYKFLPFPVKCEINRRCRRTGEDKYEVAAAATGFTSSIWWHKLYAPLLMEDTFALVFDHYKDSLFRFNASGEIVSTANMDFHKDKAYRNKLIQDVTDQDIYALNFKNGFSSLGLVNTDDAKSAEPFVLSYRYAEQIRINGNRVFYLYRPFESSQNTFLYAEWIRENDLAEKK